MEPRKELATIIKRARLESGLKQEVFAREVGVVAAHLSRLEHGQGLPSISLIQKIADRFGADRSRMIGLLRRIKGFELDDGEDRPASSRRSSLRGLAAPILSPEDCASTAEFEKGIPSGLDHGTEPVTKAMTRDRRAFWVIARGVDMCGGPISEWDLLLVEPSFPPREGRPTLICFEGRVMVRKFRDLGDAIVLDPACSEQEDLPPIPRPIFQEKNGKAFRLAGVKPTFRPFRAKSKR
jgi:transcriptional regulator with XRE-family HTH domain